MFKPEQFYITNVRLSMGKAEVDFTLAEMVADHTRISQLNPDSDRETIVNLKEKTSYRLYFWSFDPQSGKWQVERSRGTSDLIDANPEDYFIFSSTTRT